MKLDAQYQQLQMQRAMLSNRAAALLGAAEMIQEYIGLVRGYEDYIQQLKRQLPQEPPKQGDHETDS